MANGGGRRRLASRRRVLGLEAVGHVWTSLSWEAALYRATVARPGETQGKGNPGRKDPHELSLVEPPPSSGSGILACTLG